MLILTFKMKAKPKISSN